MSRISTLILLLVLAFAFPSCTENLTGEGPVVVNNRKVRQISKLAVNMGARVLVKDTSVSFCRVHAQENIQEAITTKMKGGVLYISSKGILITSEPVLVEVGMVRPQGVEVNGSATVKATNTFKNDNLSFEVNGSGVLEADMVALSTRAYVSGSGKVLLTGSTRELRAEISGSGVVDAFGLSSLEALVDISGSGQAELMVAESLKVQISGSGEVHYKGAAEVKQRVSGSGRVVKENL
jgi:hypothetical protein